GHDFADDAARRAEFHRHHTGVADDLAAERANALLGAGEVGDLHREVMDAGAFAGGTRFGGLRAGVVLDQREIDGAVAQMPRRMVAHAVGAHLAEAEHLPVELRGALEVLDLQREMHDTAHHSSFSKVLNFAISAISSSAHTASQRRRARLLPKTGAMRS